jgi:heterodisulfide reductase subunit B
MEESFACYHWQHHRRCGICWNELLGCLPEACQNGTRQAVTFILELSRKILKNAKNVCADAIVIACSLCQVNLDARQKQIEEEFEESFNLSIIYFTQWMGFAFGLKSEAFGLDKHFVDLVPFPQQVL